MKKAPLVNGRLCHDKQPVEMDKFFKKEKKFRSTKK